MTDIHSNNYLLPFSEYPYHKRVLEKCPPIPALNWKYAIILVISQKNRADHII